MTCDKCGSEVLRMTFRDDAFGCEFCLPVQGQFGNASGVIVKGDIKGSKMTRADIMHIRTRHIGRDGRVHAHPRWERKDI